MKWSLIKNYLLIAGAVTLLHACKPETIPGIGEPFDKLQLLQGNWQLQKVIQSDLNAIKYGFPYKEVNVTGIAPFTDFKLSLNLDNGKPSAFTTVPGGSPKIITLPSGKWSVDDETVPKTITLANTTDTMHINLAGYNELSQGQLHLQLIKGIDGKDLLRYDYYFKKL